MRQSLLLAAAMLIGWSANAMAAEKDKNYPKATFAGGCFWCMQVLFDNTEGVVSTVVGYTGGEKENPGYEDVSSGRTGHVEAIQITFNPAKTSYNALLELYWKHIDPTDTEGQFTDQGSQYHTIIFTQDDAQKEAAEASKQHIAKELGGKKIATLILPAQPFYPAEEYHQRYYKKNSLRYNMYHHGSGRDERLEQLWGKEKKE